MINTQGTLRKGVQRGRKNMQERTRKVGGNTKKTTPHQEKKIIFSSLSPEARNTSAFWFGFFLTVVLWRCWSERRGRGARPSSRLGSAWPAQPGLHRQPVHTDATSFLEVDSLRMRVKWLASKERMSRGKKERLVGAGLRLQCSSR